MAEYIDKNNIRGTGLIFTGEDDMYTSGQADGANKMWNKILSLPTADVIPIPEDATNGDMMKAMFPNMKIHEGNNVLLDIRGQEQEIEISGIASTEWWNAPFCKPHKAESEE